MSDDEIRISIVPLPFEVVEGRPVPAGTTIGYKVVDVESGVIWEWDGAEWVVWRVLAVVP